MRSSSGISVNRWRDSVQKKRLNSVDRIIGQLSAVSKRLAVDDNPAARELDDCIRALKILKRELEAT